MPISSSSGLRGNTAKNLGLLELIAIAVGGMIGGGIFSVLGISVSIIGAYTPIAISLGGVIAFLAAYSYVKLGVHYRDEGATYSFVKKTFPAYPVMASLIGWFVIFGYISTISLYAYTFSSYVVSGLSVESSELLRKLVAGLVIAFFALINIWSVKGMGKVEDIMVYLKLGLLCLISYFLITNNNASLPDLLNEHGATPVLNIFIVASLTFVAYEGFQLVINAVNETECPEKNIPRAIYIALFITVTIYFLIAFGAVLSIPFEELIRNKEYALAAGADKIMGSWGADMVILGAVLATSSAINGTLFGASRQVAVIAEDGYFPAFLSHRKNSTPVIAILMMAFLSFMLIAVGGLIMILEFASITFLLVSILVAYSNYTIRKTTNSSTFLVVFSMVAMFLGAMFIFTYELEHAPKQMVFVVVLYCVIGAGSWMFSRRVKQ